MANATIQQVAAEAGVSVASVSRAFQFPEQVTEKTKKRVFAAVEKLNYIPNAQARAFRTSRTKLVIALVPDIGNTFFSEIIRGIEQAAKLEGYSILLGDTQYDHEKEQRYGDMLSERQADGLITLVPRLPNIRVMGRLPVVTLTQWVDDPTISAVSIDNFAAMRDSTNYIIGLGHRKIAYLGGQLNSPLSVERRKGFVEAMTNAKMAIDETICKESAFSIDNGEATAEMILATGVPFTAIICSSDELAIGAIQALRQRGLSVPEDVSVMGFDNITFARHTNPPLSTIAQPRGDLGREGMLMLLQILADPDVPTKRLVLPTKLIERGSTAPPRK
jgi:LacI family transcriptional regulator, repressor for deo operon, udp, cdd, tsx, nupC, and nupG